MKPTKITRPVVYRDIAMSQECACRVFEVAAQQLSKWIKAYGHNLTYPVDMWMLWRSEVEQRKAECERSGITAQAWYSRRKAGWRDLSASKSPINHRLGKRNPLSALADELADGAAVCKHTLYGRLVRGWTPDEAKYVPKGMR